MRSEVEKPNGRSKAPAITKESFLVSALADQFLMVMHDMSERFSIRHTASA